MSTTRRPDLTTDFGLEFRRIGGLPPYVFAVIDQLKIELRRAGEDVIDLGFGNPDIPSPPEVVEKLCEAAQKPRNHRYSSSRGIPKLRQAICDLYERRFGVALDPDTQAITTIGAKEGLSHLMWVLLQPGDTAVVPSPSYPIHIYAPVLAGADVARVPMGPEEDLFGNVVETFERSWPRPRVIILSFPHNPTTATVDLEFMQRAVDFARMRTETSSPISTGPPPRLVPTLRVGMPSSTLRVVRVTGADGGDAERPRRHPHAERGDEGKRVSTPAVTVKHGGDRRGVSEFLLSPSRKSRNAQAGRAGSVAARSSTRARAVAWSRTLKRA